MQVAAPFDVLADRDDTAEQVAQVGGDGDFLDRELDLAVLDPVAGGARE